MYFQGGRGCQNYREVLKEECTADTGINRGAIEIPRRENCREVFKGRMYSWYWDKKRSDWNPQEGHLCRHLKSISIDWSQVFLFVIYAYMFILFICLCSYSLGCNLQCWSEGKKSFEEEELTEVKTIMEHKLTLLESQLQELKVCMYMHLKRNSALKGIVYDHFITTQTRNLTCPHYLMRVMNWTHSYMTWSKILRNFWPMRWSIVTA